MVNPAWTGREGGGDRIGIKNSPHYWLIKTMHTKLNCAVFTPHIAPSFNLTAELLLVVAASCVSQSPSNKVSFNETD